MRTKILLLIALSFSTIQLNAQLAGNSLHFDGTDDHVICSLPSEFNSIGSNDFTIEMWVNLENSQFCRLVFAQLDLDNFACVSLNTSNEVVFYLMENSVNHSVQSTDVISNGAWTHIAVTWNSVASEAKIYIDGSEVSYAGGLYISSTGNDNAMSIGSKTDGSQVYSGELDEISIWNTVRSECEIVLNRFDKRDGTEADLVAQYGFDHGTAFSPNPGVDQLIDLTGNLNDGTLTGFNLTGATSNWSASAVQISGFISDATGITLTGTSLSPNVTADLYQWVNCADNSSVPGAINLNFDPSVDDPAYTGAAEEYAVILTHGTCIEVSECFLYDFASINGISLEDEVSVYPNPSNGLFSIRLPNEVEQIQILSMTGELVKDIDPNGLEVIDVALEELSGVYLIQVKSESAVVTKKILLQ